MTGGTDTHVPFAIAKFAARVVEQCIVFGLPTAFTERFIMRVP